MAKTPKLYQLYAPNGSRIMGTYDLVPGAALIQGVYKKGKKLIPEWEGETKMYWDGQETQKSKDGETLYLDEGGEEWKESELILKEE